MASIILLLLVSFFSLAPTGHATEPAPPVQPNWPNARQLLEASDRSRGAAASTGGVTWDIVVENHEDDRQSEIHYTVRAKNNDALAVASNPPRSRGETLLLNDQAMWFYKSGIKKPVSISSRQKLLGQAANGDIASTKYARDYEGVVVAEEKIDGKATYKLELKAKSKHVTYDRIRFWITKDTQLGIRAEFLTVSGDIFKTADCEYNSEIIIDAKKYPFISQMRIQDAVRTQNFTLLKYNSPKIEQHPDSLFNVNNILR